MSRDYILSYHNFYWDSVHVAMATVKLESNKHTSVQTFFKRQNTPLHDNICSLLKTRNLKEAILFYVNSDDGIDLRNEGFDPEAFFDVVDDYQNLQLILKQ